MSALIRIHILALGAILVGSATGCAGAEEESSTAGQDIVNQASSDVAVLTVHVRESIGYGEPAFKESECESIDSSSMDCTAAMEKRFGAPALHPIRISKSQFFCYAMHVETVSKRAAIDASAGIGFYYAGRGGSSDHFLPKSALKKVRDVTLKNGEAAEVHEFVGQGGCWEGSASSSMNARYAFKPYMQFTTQTETYKNWEEGPNQLFHGTNIHLDRSAELLK